VDVAGLIDDRPVSALQFRVFALCALVASRRASGHVLLPAGWRAERIRETIHFRRAAVRRPPGRSHD